MRRRPVPLAASRPGLGRVSRSVVRFIMPVSTGTKVNVAFVAALAILGIVSAAAFRTATEYIETNRLVARSHQVLTGLSDLLGWTRVAESSRRAFVLTGEDDHLSEYQISLNALRRVRESLGLAAADNPQLEARLRDLDPLLQKRLAVLEESIEHRRRGFDLALQARSTEQGAALMETLGEAVSNIEKSEQELLSARTARARETARRTKMTIVFASLLALGVVGIALIQIRRDLHARARGERALREASAEIRDLYNNAPCGYHSLDADGVFVRINDTELAWLGYAREEVVGKKRFVDLISEASRRVFAENFPVFKERGWVRDLEFEMVRKDGTGFPVLLSATAVRDPAGKYLMSRSVLIDLSELRRAEESLNRFFELSASMLCICGFDGTFLRVNAAWEKTLGYTPEELTREPFLNFVHPDDREATVAEFETILAGGTALNFENRYRTKDGSFRWLLWSATPYFPDRVVYAAARDVTERRRAEEEIRALNQELEAFSYSVSHDLRAPLRAIDGFSQALLEDCGDRLDEQGRDHLRRVRAATQRMAQLIDDMLTLSRVTRAELRREIVDLSKLAEEIAAELRRADPDRTAEVEIEPGLVAAGDPRLLRVLVGNLLSNAWKFTAGSEPARIELGRCPTSADGRGFFVRDNGAGFDMTYANKLFAPFQRLHRQSEFPGTGVGLAIVQRIVHRHGGRVWAEGAVGRGATFYFTL
jgi:PAS domain S-box-containing protein